MITLKLRVFESESGYYFIYIGTQEQGQAFLPCVPNSSLAPTRSQELHMKKLNTYKIITILFAILVMVSLSLQNTAQAAIQSPIVKFNIAYKGKELGIVGLQDGTKSRKLVVGLVNTR